MLRQEPGITWSEAALTCTQECSGNQPPLMNTCHLTCHLGFRYDTFSGRVLRFLYPIKERYMYVYFGTVFDSPIQVWQTMCQSCVSAVANMPRNLSLVSYHFSYHVMCNSCSVQVTTLVELTPKLPVDI